MDPPHEGGAAALESAVSVPAAAAGAGVALPAAVPASDPAARRRLLAPRPGMPYRAVKRAFDWTAALLLLVVLSPLLALAALAIKLGSPGPVLFRQRRIGRWSATFTIVKFRTMKTGTPDLASHLMGPGSAQVTPVGRFLRRTSIDELPQLWNILKGDMSLVGPRPALYNQHDLIAMRQEAGVDALQPGVSGWAQIHGRDGIPMTEKVERDRWYLERCSPGLDLVILVRTVVTLFSSKGVF
jgi:O-antigen biosynthesis protein WbqP